MRWEGRRRKDGSRVGVGKTREERGKEEEGGREDS